MHKILRQFILNNLSFSLAASFFIVFSIQSHAGVTVTTGTVYVETSGETGTKGTNVSLPLRGKGISHKGSAGIIFAFPDVCFTPPLPGSSPIAIPYPNIEAEGSLKFSNVKTGDKVSVKLKGTQQKENTPSSSGDEPGGLKGVASNKQMHKVAFKKFSYSVKVEGKGIDRFLDLTVHNGVNANEHQQIHFWDKKKDQYIFTVNINPPEIEPDLYPVMGSSSYALNAGTSINDPYQLVEIKYMADYDAVKKYLDQILANNGSDIQNGFDGMYYDPNKKAYVFISSQRDNWLYKEPVLKNGNIWFEGVAKDRSQKSAFSAWLFYVPKDLDFRVRIKTYEFDTELGRATLLSERFKLGIKKPSRARDFQILYSGEYFDEDKLVYASNGRVSKKKSFGIKSYSNYVYINKGSLIGFSFVYKGVSPQKYKFRIIPPSDRLQPTELDITCQPNKQDQMIWQFSKEEELLEGDWTFQITDNSNVVYEESVSVGIDNKMISNSGIRVKMAQAGQKETDKTTFGDMLERNNKREFQDNYKKWENVQIEAEGLIVKLKDQGQTTQTDKAEKLLREIRLNMQKGEQWNKSGMISKNNKQINSWFNQLQSLSSQAESSSKEIVSVRVKTKMQDSLQRLSQMMQLIGHILKQMNDITNQMIDNTKG